MARYDLAITGAGIVGLAHALAAARRGLRVIVVERDARACRSSLQNFGFITVTGQAAGETWRRAQRSRDVWLEVAAGAGIAITQRGALVLAQRPEALAVLEEFAASSMGEGCEIRHAAATRMLFPGASPVIVGSLLSQQEVRIEPREAIPALTAWLATRHGVEFRWDATVQHVEEGCLHLGDGRIDADAIVVAPGANVAALYPALAREIRLRQCQLQMLRLRAATPALRLPATVMSDLSLLRYAGFAAVGAAAALRRRLEAECAPQLADGVHLIVAQGADGSLVVGDSHHYSETPDAFAPARVEDLIIAELRAVLDLPHVDVSERWLGSYPVADEHPMLIREMGRRTRLVSVTGGIGMSTGFALGEESIDALFGPA
jgi:FAD dependent oxidoreductase TIGR03364